MQLRLSVQLWPGDEVRLDLDGRSYRLNLCSAVRLVLPQQLVALLPSTMLQLHDSFFAVAPLSPVPYLTLVFPHACFNMFPLGWKAAAAHLSKEHDASELLRLAHVLAVSQSGQLQQQQNSRATASAPPDVPSADWQSEHSAMLAALQRMSAAAELLRQAGSCAAACPDPAVQQAWQELAVSASTLCDQRSAAAAALPAEKLSLQSKQSCLASLMQAVVGRPGCDAHAACDQAKQALAGPLGQQRQAAACSMLAAPV
ncbi:hypothetical protein D9Q98_006902 [Chlorella vulgaris]|uniref:Uncharacterized protein n=1 Tax=Chlorella vulgaris TaxID=3077 RepID=A0A9D4TJ33_CHLVU|nr:hypothetical protein D9Q98_006902 [Chlorella vulgaris]